MRLTAPALLALLLAASACGERPAEQPAETRAGAGPADPDQAPIATRSTDAAALAAAFEAAFDEPEQRIGDDLYRFEPAALYRLPDRWVLLSEGSGPDCNACSGWLAVHYLARDETGFAVRGSWLDAIPGSSYGAPPEWRVRTDLMAAPVIQSEASGMGQGISCRVARLTALAPGGPLTRAERIPLDYSDAGAVLDGASATSVEGTILPAAEGEGFVVRYTGSAARDIAWQPAGERFAPGAGAAAVPQC